MIIGILGATGYSGKLVVEYFQKHVDHALTNVVLGGRSMQKLRTLQKDFGFPESVTLEVVDVLSRSSLDLFVAHCDLVVNCVGPFRLYGENVVSSCVSQKKHYVDIDGEPEFILRMTQKYDSLAKENGVMVILAAGFDSVPCDLGVALTEQLLANSASVSIRGSLHLSGPGSISSGSMSGVSHGTFSSLLLSLKSGSPRKRDEFKDTTSSSGRAGDNKALRSKPSDKKPPFAFRDKDTGRWTMRFPVADPYVVRKTHTLLANFRTSYTHYIQFDSFFRFLWFACLFAVLAVLSKVPVVSTRLSSLKSEGSGPSPDQRKKSSFEMLFFVRGVRDNEVENHRTVIRGPEVYEATAICVSEVARLALLSSGKGLARSGVLTPCAAVDPVELKHVLEPRGITFQVLY
eukprot:ANDGO_05911.mRNA.1 putative mitochondrial saccharopine dehydrogenase-like oxidoreductase At5g39410